MTDIRKEPLRPPLWVIVALILAAVCWMLYELKEMVMLMVVGYSIAYLIHPTLCWLEKKNISRSIGVFVIFALLFLFIFLIAVTAIPTILEEYEAFSTNFHDYLAVAKEKFSAIVNEFYPNLVDGKFSFSSIVPNFDAQTVNKVVAAFGTTLLKGYSITLTLVNLALLPFIVYYIAVDFEAVHQAGLKLVPAKHRESVRKMGSEINIYVAAFVRGQMLVALVLLVLYALGLGIVGVQLWFLLAVIAGLANMVPYLGTALGITLSSIMALVTFGDFPHLLAVWIVFGIIQILEGSFITPKIVGDKVGLSPLIVILAIFAGGSLFGLVGIMLAVPGAATLRVLGRNLMKWIEQRSEGIGAA